MSLLRYSFTLWSRDFCKVILQLKLVVNVNCISERTHPEYNMITMRTRLTNRKEKNGTAEKKEKGKIDPVHSCGLYNIGDVDVRLE